jgi:DNA-binding NarL/FixJ family response regulator
MNGTSTASLELTIGVISRQPLVWLGFQNMFERAETPWFVLHLHPQMMPGALWAGQQPDVVILDLETQRDAVGLIKQIRESAPNSKIVLLSGFAGQERMREAFACGVDGVILMVHPPAVVLATIEALCLPETHRGQVARHEAVCGGDQRTMSKRTVDSKPLPPAWPDALTEREREVIELLTQGLSNKEIAYQLSISDSTVRHHLTNIFDKVGVPNRQLLLIHAHQVHSVS